jgi:hypothetical protein
MDIDGEIGLDIDREIVVQIVVEIGGGGVKIPRGIGVERLKSKLAKGSGRRFASAD